MFIKNAQEIIDDASIENVVASEVSLNRKKMACCPFHNERTPSFSASDKKGVAKCFGGCDKSWNAATFLMEKNGLTFPEAVKKIAEIEGLKVEYAESKLTDEERAKAKAKADKKAALYIQNSAVLKLYQDANIYLKHSPPTYFRDGDKNKMGYIRNWKIGHRTKSIKFLDRINSKETIDAFALFQPQHSAFICNKIVAAGLNRDLLLEAGILRNSNRGDYDRFYNRHGLPVHDHLGRVCGFVGRKIDEDKSDKAKYINSDEGLTYEKGKILYGLFQNKKGIKKAGKAILIESNSSTLVLHQEKIRNVVAQGGTSLTPSQAKLLKRFTDEVLICYDADPAGIKAAQANIPTLLRTGLVVEICILPLKFKKNGELDKGPDPGDYVEKNGGQAFKEYIKENKLDAIVWAVMHTLGEGKGMADKDKALLKAVELISLVKSDTMRSMLVTKLAGKNFIGCGKPTLLGAVKERLLAKEENKKGVKNKYSDTQLSDITEFGFFEQGNCYYTINEENGNGRKVSNFTIEPIFLLRDSETPRRLVKITNNRGISFYRDIHTDAFVELSAFKKVIAQHGNFRFFGKPEDFQRVIAKIYDNTPTCYPIDVLGHHNAGFYAWGNGVFARNKFHRVDNNGIVKFDDNHFYLPAFSNVQTTERFSNSVNYDIEERFSYEESKITIENWANLFFKVHKENAKLSIPYYLSSLFKDFIFQRFKFFPHSFHFGISGSGKSYHCRSMAAMFGVEQNPFMLSSGTSVAFYRWFSKFRNALIWFDEYNDDISDRRIQHLKAAYDGASHQKGTLKGNNETISNPVSSACNISGQTLPIGDIALIKRCIVFKYSKTKFSDSDIKSATELKKLEATGQLSAITSLFTMYRDIVKKEFNDKFDKITSRLKTDLKGNITIEDRILNNTAITIAVFAIISEREKFPFTLEDVYEAAKNQIIWQSSTISESDELSVFWALLESMLEDSDCQISLDRDFTIKKERKIKVKIESSTRTKQIDLGEGKDVLFVRFTNIYPEYLKKHRLQYSKVGMHDKSLKHYLKASPAFLGEIRGRKFQGKTSSCYAFDYELLGINLENTDVDAPSYSLDETEPEKTTTDNTIDRGDRCSCIGECKCDLPF